MSDWLQKVSTISHVDRYFVSRGSDVCFLIFQRKYCPITNNEQRCSYKRDFQVEYQEYQKLQNQINSVTKKFEELKENLRQCPEQSEEREVCMYVEQEKNWEKSSYSYKHINMSIIIFR